MQSLTVESIDLERQTLLFSNPMLDLSGSNAATHLIHLSLETQTPPLRRRTGKQLQSAQGGSAVALTGTPLLVGVVPDQLLSLGDGCNSRIPVQRNPLGSLIR